MMLQTVKGPVSTDAITLTDGHGHVWIQPPDGTPPESRLELNDYGVIAAELHDFRAAGGAAVIDCQPGGCGRDARMLVRLSEDTGVHLTATTGFHRQKYYPPGSWLWSVPAEAAADYFMEELTSGMRETGGTVRATTIKIGYEGVIEGQSRVLMEAAAAASRRTGAAILCHTERGANVEALLPFFARRGVAADRLYLCHVDKRPDAGLHRELAQAGALLGYDTFARPQYDPERGVWPLLRLMAADGLAAHIAIGLDLASASQWQRGGGPGMRFLIQTVVPRLRAEGLTDAVIGQLTGQNVARHLARKSSERQE
jgi:predicted metal-dependent phosphotriesterase family hydrolase